MSTLAEIEAVADSLSGEDKQTLLRFLTTSLREKHGMTGQRTSTDLMKFAGTLCLAENPLDWQRRMREE